MWLRNRLLHAWFLIRRPMTLGARAIVLDGHGGVLLVRHTYVADWHLPGGGIEPGETAADCVRREVREEANVEIGPDMALHGLFYNEQVSRRDHVAVYVCRMARRLGPGAGGREIAAADFFPLDAPPMGVTPGTARRLEEWRTGAVASSRW